MISLKKKVGDVITLLLQKIQPKRFNSEIIFNQIYFQPGFYQTDLINSGDDEKNEIYLLGVFRAVMVDLIESRINNKTNVSLLFHELLPD